LPREHPKLRSFLKICRKGSLVRIRVASREKKNFLVGLDTERFEGNDNRDVFVNAIVSKVDLPLLRRDVGLGF
jgi:hypothetical protein